MSKTHYEYLQAEWSGKRMTGEEYNNLENKWQELYRRRRKLQKELEVVNSEMQKIEKEINK